MKNNQKPLSKNEVNKLIANNLKMQTKDVNCVLEELKKVAMQQVKACGEFKLLGIGKLKIRQTKAREMRNPQNGKMVHVPAKRVVKFAVSKEFKSL